MVSARSGADTPVVQPSSLSTVIVKGVPSIDVLSATWCGKSNSFARDNVIGAHSTPRACLSMKFTASAVIFSAAIIKSPSFSRSSSSTTITNFPSLKSLRASSILLNLNSPICFLILISGFSTFIVTIYNKVAKAYYFTSTLSILLIILQFVCRTIFKSRSRRMRKRHILQ